jgi:hypothetical protein
MTKQGAEKYTRQIHNRRLAMEYYEKTKNDETFILVIDERGNYSVASNLDPDPDGFIGPVDPDAKGYTATTRERAEQVLGYDPEE